MPKTEQDRIKRQLNYYFAKNIDSLKSKFYGEDGIWSKYHAFTERFVIEDDEEIHCRTVFPEDNSNKEVSSDKEANTGITERKDVLSLETYCLGLNHTDPSHSDKNNFGAFSWWIEFYLKDLGAVGGSSSAVHGIYYSPKSKCYRNAKNTDIFEENGTDLSKEEYSHDMAQNRFTDKTYICIKRKLVSGGNIEDESLSDFKPNNVVLNKIYYLFKMQELDVQGCANHHLIPIFKEKSLDYVIELLYGKKKNVANLTSWEDKSEFIFTKFAEFLDIEKEEQSKLDSIPTVSVADNKVEYVNINEGLKSTAINLFKSYCFGCFFWSTLENQGGLSDKIDELISRGDKNIILTGAPGTGKTFACKNYAREQVGNFISDIPENLEKRKTVSELLKNVSEVLKTVDGCNQSSSPSPDYFIKTVQFHPGYDYSDFIEGLRPKKVGDSNTIIYDRKDGIFKEFCKKVVLFNKQVAEFNKTGNNEKSPLDSSKFFFIIDEINRGEVSKIFGEAFSMIETDKRAPVDSNSEDVTNKVDTQYSSLIENKDDPFQHGFYIPENVYILATMNEIDRSLEAMDFAFRRRFSWLTVEVQDTLNEIIVNSVLGACTNSVSKNMSAIEYSFNELNELIKKNLGPDYMLGGSYLTSLKNSSRTSVKALKEELWNNHLEPIIKDYIKGIEDNIEVYRSKFVDSNVGSINDDSKKEPLNVKQ